MPGPPCEGFPLSFSFSPAPSSSHPLTPYGWDEDWAAAFSPYAEQGLVPGRVVRVDRGQCDVITADGNVRADTAFVVPRDPMRIVCTGDWVALDADGDPRFVRTLLRRRTAFVRSTSSQRSEGQVLATNIDHIAICVSLAVELDLGRLERFLALALSSSSGAALLGDGQDAGHTPEPIVLLTKADLVPDAATLAHLVQDVEAIAPGVQVLPVSSTTGEGLDVFGAVVSGGTSVLLGISGAGKSTLANTLLGRDVMEVRAARDVDGKGGTPRRPATCSSCRTGASSSTPPGSAEWACTTPGPGSARCSPRSRSWHPDAGSMTAPTWPSRGAPSSVRWRTGSCPSGGSTATAS